MGIDALVEKAGPTLATGIILAVLTGAATVVMAWRDHVSASAVRIGQLTDDHARLRADFDSFRSPGDRFTADMGRDHAHRMDELDRRIREQEQRPPRLNPHLDKVEDRVRALEGRVSLLEQAVEYVGSEQEKLCQRLQGCKR